jgi:hypothetical protein
LYSLVNSVSSFIVNTLYASYVRSYGNEITISAKDSTEVEANLSIEICQNAYIPKICVNRLMKARYPKIEVQNSLTLNPDLTALTENPEESASNVILYHHTFGVNNM